MVVITNLVFCDMLVRLIVFGIQPCEAFVHVIETYKPDIGDIIVTAFS